MTLQYSVVVVDIRNFSSHRFFLGNESKASMLTGFIKNFLDDAITSIWKIQKARFTLIKPLFNHTGDGFVLAVPGKKSPLIMLEWLSNFKKGAEVAIKEYQKELVELFPNNTLEPLDFGIGIHFGQVAVFKFKDFKGEESNTGFLGSAVNIASRVEQQTKDHPYQLLCTKKFRDAVLNATTKAKNWFFRFYNG